MRVTNNQKQLINHKQTFETMTNLQKELLELTKPNEKGRRRILSMTEKMLKYEISMKKHILATWDDEGDVLSGRINIIDR